MTHIEVELHQLKNDCMEMWQSVILQLKKARKSLDELDKDLAREVLLTEKRINAMELKIDRDCENIFALFNPVANDLRFVLAVLKINNNLERVGDIAEGIAKFVLYANNNFDKKLIQLTKADIMFEEALQMSIDALHSFNLENADMARAIFKKDDLIDEINLSANDVIAQYIREHLEHTEQALYLLSVIRKLERVGDQMKNVAEEIIFYIEAKILRHSNPTS
jgi:phosphate transport system protein